MTIPRRPAPIQPRMVKLLRSIIAVGECIAALPVGSPIRVKLQTAEANLLEVVRGEEGGGND